MGRDTFVPAKADKRVVPDVLGAIFADKGRPTLVAVGQIRTDGGTQMRAGLDDSTVFEYTQTMVAAQGWGEFPAVIAYHDGKDYWLADGFHRVAAFKDGFPDATKTIPVEVRAGTRRDAILHAAGANASHGLRRSNADKRRAVDTLLRDSEWAAWSDREIARVCNVSHTLIAQMRQHLTVNIASEKPAERTYTTKHGTTATMQTANIGKPAPVLNTAPAGETRQQQIEREWRESNASRIAYLDENARRNEEHFRQMREQLAAARAQQEPEAAVISLDELEVVASVTVPAAAPKVVYTAPAADPDEEIDHPLDCYEENGAPAAGRMRDLWELQSWFKQTGGAKLREYRKLTGRDVSAGLVSDLTYMVKVLEEAMNAFQAEVEAKHVNQ